MENIYDNLIKVWDKVITYLKNEEIEMRKPFFDYIEENKENKYIQKYCLSLLKKYERYLKILEKQTIDIDDAIWISKYYLTDNFIRPYMIMNFIERISDLYMIKRIYEIEEFYLFFFEQDIDCININEIKLKEKIQATFIKMSEYKKEEIEFECKKEFTTQEIRKVRSLKMFVKRAEQVIKKCKI